MPPALLLARRLMERGHEPLVVSDSANREAAEASGLSFASWDSAPNRQRAGSSDDPLQDWRSRWPPAIVRSICGAVISGPSACYARDTAALIDRFQPDVVLSNELLFGCMIAAEARRIPLALLSANVWCFPTRADVPPFGPAFAPARGRFTEGRNQSARNWIARLYDVGLSALNATRASFGLARLAHTLDQLRSSRLNLLATSATFDYGATSPEPPFLYAGPLLEAPEWARERVMPAHSGPEPLILVSFSTAYQNQHSNVALSIRALARLPVKGLVTLGPAVAAEGLPAARNVSVVRGASHATLLPHCAALLCHGGHGTLVRALLHGVPVVCKPEIRDQPENAARLRWHGAGIRVGPWTGVQGLRSAVERVLADPSYRHRAQRLGTAIRSETDDGRRAVDALCGLGQCNRSVSTASVCS